jgi:hypothetical protein
MYAIVRAPLQILDGARKIAGRKFFNQREREFIGTIVPNQNGGIAIERCRHSAF